MIQQSHESRTRGHWRTSRCVFRWSWVARGKGGQMWFQCKLIERLDEHPLLCTIIILTHLLSEAIVGRCQWIAVNTFSFMYHPILIFNTRQSKHMKDAENSVSYSFETVVKPDYLRTRGINTKGTKNTNSQSPRSTTLQRRCYSNKKMEKNVFCRCSVCSCIQSTENALLADPSTQ